MLIAALGLIAAGVLIAATGLASWLVGFDFAVSVMPGWHVTVFPLPPSVGVLLIISGVALLASLFWR